MLQISDVRAGYGAINILWDVSLSITQGTITAIVGPNGAGKTTLLRTMMGLIRSTQGSIKLAGKEIAGIHTWNIGESGMTLIPEGRMIFRDMSVEDNLVVGAFSRQNRPHVKQRLEIMYDMFPRLKARAKQMAGVLSGGEAQMLALSRGLMSDPDTLLIDEPSLGLAPAVVDELFEIFARLRNAGKTIVLVEQNTHRAIALADQVHLMQGGKITYSKAAIDVHVDELHAAYFQQG
jgi:branched-chain amino acid transport system ATP-binding protein